MLTLLPWLLSHWSGRRTKPFASERGGYVALYPGSACVIIHGRQVYHVDDERECYCVHCAPEGADAVDDGHPVVEPDKR